MKEVQNPHDAFVKSFLKKIEHAREILQAMMPAKLAQQLNWQSLERLPKTFISQQLKEFQSDALFTIYWQASHPADKQPAISLQLYLLFEHKSYVDKNIHLQLGRYLFEIYHSQKQLTPVLPLLLYHGQKKWHVPTSFIDMFGLEQEQKELIQNFIPNFCYNLFDVNLERQSSEMKKERHQKMSLHAITQLLFYSLQYIWNVEEEAKLREFFGKVAQILLDKDNNDLFEKLLLYFFQYSNMEPQAMSKIITQELNKEKGDKAMTTAERLHKEGMEEGVERGIERGKIETARELKQKGMDNAFIQDVTKLSKEQIEKL